MIRCILGLPCHQMAQSWEFPTITRLPWLPRLPHTPPPIGIASEDDCPWETLLGTRPGVPPLIFRPYILFRGLIATSFLGTCDTRYSPRAHPFASRLGDTQVRQGLALVIILSTNMMYLGYDITPVSPGASPVTLTPGGGGGNLIIVRPAGKYLF